MILNINNKSNKWAKLGIFLEYKALMHGKLVIEVPAAYSSQECSYCGSTDSKNRIKTKFCCLSCGYKDHADVNASKVISSRVYKALLNYAEEALKKESAKKKKEEKLNKVNKVSVSMECREEVQMMV